MSKTALIIGGGIGGLSAGIYAQLNGFSSTIYEMNAISGGLCTAWKRKGYTFDGCVHWLTGTDPSSEYYTLWEEIGAVEGKRFHNYDFYSHAIDTEGRRFVAYCDPERLRQEMLSIAPEDKKAIDEIIEDIKKFMRYGLPLEFKISNLYPALRALLLLYKYREPVAKLAEKFSNPTLKHLFLLGLDWGPMCSSFLLWTISLLANKNGGYPMGGSLPLIESVEKRYTQLGGKIRFHQKVVNIIVENDTAVGIKLSDGTEVRGDIIISAADGYTTIFKWLEGRYVNPRIKKMYDTLIPFPPLVFISLGINGTYPDTPHSFSFDLKKPFFIGLRKIDSLFCKNYTYDPAMAPPGKTVFTLMLTADFDYWENLRKEKRDYEAEKQRIGEEVINALGELHTGLPSQVKVIDIATPMTFVRYTGNWKGSYEGWMFDKKALSLRPPQTLPGLENFYMVGHWVSPGGGLPSGPITAKSALKLICKKEKIKFRTNI